MPLFGDGRGKALTTKQANESRIVTACGYAVENINEKIKQKFLYFWSIVQNSTVKTLFRIACAIHNFTFKAYDKALIQ